LRQFKLLEVGQVIISQPATRDKVSQLAIYYTDAEWLIYYRLLWFNILYFGNTTSFFRFT